MDSGVSEVTPSLNKCLKLDFSQREPCDAPTEGDPDDVTGGREEMLAVVGVGGGGQRPCRITRIGFTCIGWVLPTRIRRAGAMLDN